MISITTLLYITAITTVQGFTNIKKTIHVGSSSTLEGYQSQSRVSWYWYYRNQPAITLCKGSQETTIRTIKYKCNNNNLTLIDVTAQYAGTYYGTNFNIGQDTYYTITVINSTTPVTTTIKPTKTKSTKTHIFPSSKPTSIYTTSLLQLLQKANVTDNYTINPTLPSEEIPKSMIGIIAAVVAGMLIIILCMIYYACCYRKYEHEQKIDPLLSFDI